MYAIAIEISVECHSQRRSRSLVILGVRSSIFVHTRHVRRQVLLMHLAYCMRVCAVTDVNSYDSR